MQAKDGKVYMAPADFLQFSYESRNRENGADQLCYSLCREEFDGRERQSGNLSCEVMTDSGAAVVISDTAEYSAGPGGLILFATVRTRSVPSSFGLQAFSDRIVTELVRAYIVSTAVCSAEITSAVYVTDGSGGKWFSSSFDIQYLGKVVKHLLRRADFFINDALEWNEKSNKAIAEMKFPYSSVRQGQKDIMLAVLDDIRNGKSRVISAPTGLGKTIAFLYPAVKMIPEGKADRIYYLTSKTTTGNAAADTARIMDPEGRALRVLVLRSKAALCRNSISLGSCFQCEKKRECVTGGRSVTVRERFNAALKELLVSTGVFTAGEIKKTADRYGICPYELSRTLVRYCNVVICDYNYVFDPVVRLSRDIDSGCRNVFLTDEAHNLPDRVRKIFSFEFDPEEVSFKVRTVSSGDDTALKALDGFDRIVSDVKSMCLDESYLSDEGDEKVGFFTSEEIPEGLADCCRTLRKTVSGYMRKNGENSPPELTAVLDALSSVIVTDEHILGGGRFLAELRDGRTVFRYICIDPSFNISHCASIAVSALYFSATFDPLEFFSRVLGCDGNEPLVFDSPFDGDNLCITVYDGADVRYSARRDSIPHIADVIETTVSARHGHYMVYFQSYEFLDSVLREFIRRKTDYVVAVQKKDMSHEERDRFIRAFRSEKIHDIVGFCVLGGIFSEGIDLTGESLIGAVVVGAGIPPASSAQNMITEYYEDRYEAGRLYSEVYPAINKIEQAAGRVIRSEDDCGVVVLVDDRFTQREYLSVMMRDWKKIRCTSDTESLAGILDRFWEEHGPSE